MKTENILYTDGHDVIVTTSYFKVKKALYQLNGITNHGFLIMRPERLPALLVAILGVALIVLGITNVIPDNLYVSLFSLKMSGKATAAGLGLAFFTVAIAALSFMRERYAIRIATAEGEKNVIVSRKKEYVKLILDALNHAVLDLVAPKARSGKTSGGYQVSHR